MAQLAATALPHNAHAEGGSAVGGAGNGNNGSWGLPTSYFLSRHCVVGQWSSCSFRHESTWDYGTCTYSQDMPRSLACSRGLTPPGHADTA